jgi:hypothetical protein
MSKIRYKSQVLVVHACNPTYSGGRDQEDCGLKPVQANSSQDPISKNLHKNRTGRVAQGEGPEFKPQCCKKKKDTKYNIPTHIHTNIHIKYICNHI